jgi:hypothetical protein
VQPPPNLSIGARQRWLTLHRYLRAVFENKRASLHVWQDRIRNPSLMILLVLQLLLISLALPLAASGVPIAEPIVASMLLVVLTLVVMLSHRGIAILVILLGLATIAASIALGGEWSSVSASVLNRSGIILVFSALTWVVAHAVYAPGRITFHRLQGAVVVYLSLAMIFAAAFSLVWELIPGTFANLPTAPRSPKLVEFVHEMTYARSSRPDHLREDFLTKLSDDWLRPAVLAEIRKEKENALDFPDRDESDSNMARALSKRILLSRVPGRTPTTSKMPKSLKAAKPLTSILRKAKPPPLNPTAAPRNPTPLNQPPPNPPPRAETGWEANVNSDHAASPAPHEASGVERNNKERLRHAPHDIGDHQ